MLIKTLKTNSFIAPYLLVEILGHHKTFLISQQTIPPPEVYYYKQACLLVHCGYQLVSEFWMEVVSVHVTRRLLPITLQVIQMFIINSSFEQACTKVIFNFHKSEGALNDDLKESNMCK